MKKSWKIGLMITCGIILTSSISTPILTSCSYSGKYKESNPVSNSKYQFKNNDFNFYDGLNWNNSFEWVNGILSSILNQAQVEATQNAKLSSWNKNINEKCFPYNTDNQFLKNKKLTNLYSLTFSNFYPIMYQIPNINIFGLVWDIFKQVFNLVKDMFNGIYEAIKYVVVEILKEFAKDKTEQIKQKIEDIINKLIKKMNLNEFNDFKSVDNYYPIVESNYEDKVRENLVKELNGEQKAKKYDSFVFMNDEINIETDYLFDRYLFFHSINALIYKNGYNSKKNISFINIEDGALRKAIEKLLIGDVSELIILILEIILESIPISYEALLLNDSHIRINRWEENINDSEIEMQEYALEINKRFEKLNTILNEWISNSLAFVNSEIDLNQYTDWLLDYVNQLLNEIGIRIDKEKFNEIINSDKVKDSLKIKFSLSLGEIYSTSFFPIVIRISSLLCNNKFNIFINIYQLLIDQIAKLGPNNIHLINQIKDFFLSLGDNIENLISNIKQLISIFKNWMKKVQEAIKKNDKNSKKIKELLKQIINLFKTLGKEDNKEIINNTINEIKSIIEQINNLINYSGREAEIWTLKILI